MELFPRLADSVEKELIRIHQEMCQQFGPDEKRWTPGQVRAYLLAQDAARIETGWVVA